MIVSANISVVPELVKVATRLVFNFVHMVIATFSRNARHSEF